MRTSAISKTPYKPSLTIASSSEKVYGRTIRQMAKRRKTSGRIGIEVEVEGNKFPKTVNEPAGIYEDYHGHLVPSVWTNTKDGSLRGYDNNEYVLRSPLEYKKARQSVVDLWNMFDEFGSKLDDSNRTSVHVHLNAQEWHLNQVCSFVAMYLSVETLLTQWCGDHRVGNLFCLTARDAPGQVSKIKDCLRTDDLNYLTDGLHYSALNLHALRKFGSIEIRTMRGPQTAEPLLLWIDLLNHMYEVAQDIKDPRDLIEGFSGGGVDTYLDKVFGPFKGSILSSLDIGGYDLSEVVLEGIRIAQDITYCRDWSLYDTTTPSKEEVNKRRKEEIMPDETFMSAPMTANTPISTPSLENYN